MAQYPSRMHVNILDTFAAHGSRDGIGFNIDFQESDELSSNELDLITDAILLLERKLGGGIGVGTGLWDADRDTGIQTEEAADEDVLRFDVAGTERLAIFDDGHIDQQFNNLLLNWSFEHWDAGAAAAPSGWTLSAAGGESVARQAATVRFGNYSAAVTRVGFNCYLQQDAIVTIGGALETYWRGRIVTLGCWVYATVASRARLRVLDGVDDTYSAYHTGGSTWEFLTVTHTLNAGATGLDVRLGVDTGNTVVYFDGAILVEGPICPTSAPKPVDHNAGWQAWVPTLTGGAGLSGYDSARFCLYGKISY